MEKPNILFVLTDDLGWGDVSYHGSRIRTPNIDRLVSRGVELDAHYVNPVCTPTRASLMTGRYPGRFGKQATTPENRPILPDGYFTLATMLRDAGYATGLFGKWHLASDPDHGPNKYGFDYSYGSLAGGVDPYNHRYKPGKWSHTWHRNGDLIEFEPGHVTDLLTDEALRWISDQDQPWFCYMPYTAVHTPIRAPERWLDDYWFGNYDPDPELDRSFKEYAAYTSHMDYNVGRLIELLKCLDQIHNTIVVFASDNGAPTHHLDLDAAKYPGWHEDMPRRGSNGALRGSKATVWEGGIRTPGAVMWRSVLEPGKLTAPTHIVDWMPTLANLLGCDVPGDPAWDGVDIWPLITDGERTTGRNAKGPGEPAGDDRAIYWNLLHERFAVRNGGFKLIHRRHDPVPETLLFNVEEDPYEEREISGAHPDVVDRLSGFLEAQHALDDSSKRSDLGDD
jgi:arylsulfatase A-like enzyme